MSLPKPLQTKAMAGQIAEASTSASASDPVSFGPEFLTNPLDYIKNVLMISHEKEKDVHDSCTSSIYFRPTPTKDNTAAQHKEDAAKGVQEEPKKKSKFKAFKRKFKSLSQKNKVTQVSEKKTSTSAAVAIDAAFEPLTDAMDRLYDFYQEMMSDMSKLEDVLHISTVEEHLQKTEQEVIDEIAGKLLLFFVFIVFHGNFYSS